MSDIVNIDFLTEKESEMERKSKRRGGGFSQRFSPERGKDYTICVVPPFRKTEDGKLTVFGGSKRVFTDEYVVHEGLNSEADFQGIKTQRIPSMASTKGEKDPVDMFIEANPSNHGIKGYKRKERTCLYVIEMDKIVTIKTKDGNEKVFVPKVDEEKGMAQIKVWDVGQMLAASYIQALVAYFNNMKKEGDDPSYGIERLMCFNYKVTGKGLDTTHTLTVNQRMGFILNHLKKLKKDIKNDSGEVTSQEVMFGSTEDVKEYLTTPSCALMFHPTEVGYQAFIRNESSFNADKRVRDQKKQEKSNG
jgi:hypothetical protein